MLRDHFRPPLSRRRPWHSTHHVWATAIAADLNERLPNGWFAAANVQFGIEIDVATFEEPESLVANRHGSTDPFHTAAYSPPPPAMTLEFPVETDVVEVEIFAEEEELRLAGAIELISPANKDRREHRRAFLAKCETLLRRGVGVTIIDVVTTRRANLHARLLKRFGVEAVAQPGELYACSYHPVSRGERDELDVWEERLLIGSPLPVLPLSLLGGPTVPLNLNETYERACREQRIV
ncbi:MAG: DUF4058 family protein [Planctomycetaceae bacterium]